VLDPSLNRAKKEPTTAKTVCHVSATFYLVNTAFASTGSWRWPLALAFVPALVLLIGMYFLPETPR